MSARGTADSGSREREDREIRHRCTRFLSGHIPVPPETSLSGLASAAGEDAADYYGSGGAVGRLETRVAGALYAPSALFFARGMVAQFSALQVHAEATGARNIALHPMSHIAMDEANAVHHVCNLESIFLGSDAHFTTSDLDRIAEPLAAVVVELPLRRAGYLLPSLNVLEDIALWCRARAIPLHLDGARLWEAAAGLDVAPATLAAFADTVYTSFYKGIGGLGGAMLLGSEAAVSAAKIWRKRYAGDPYTSYPTALSALIGLDRHLHRFPVFVCRARLLAQAIAGHDKMILHPEVPHANAFQILLPGTPDALAQSHGTYAAQTKTWLFNRFSEDSAPGHSVAEVVIGDASDHYTPEEAAGWVSAFASHAMSAA